jgi:hypothetical protein
MLKLILSALVFVATLFIMGIFPSIAVAITAIAIVGMFLLFKE